ncbi:hypothetical protein [Microbispora bryophytorum]|uniref:Uncharacterized protein n=1 Tax=Microbispora bryophytorum TaxID=1460882 RepID=A0A8H9H5P7_9ACTN|nr:hypothetical protein [Microbispora bryophytorum]MBD3137793.1 hypothetical protein [Microbispora bryophytorum]TQS05546.1 hypothetical protein FLX07_17065 [Microbispora bryophytorum]GGO20979.1 hypothetical protein GCM10011574_47930 [Microbispora bryophytorum]
MTSDIRGRGQAGVTAESGSQAALDYYLITPAAGTDGAPAEGIVVEEFTLTEDFRTVGLDTAGWTAADGVWWSSAAFGRAMREDPGLRTRVRAVSRPEAESAYHDLGGGELPGETRLRALFHDHQPLPDSPPLRLSPPRVDDGFHDTRVYRVLFAGEPHLSRLADVVTLAVEAGDPRTRVVGTGELRTASDVFTWDVRRIGPGAACSVDLTAHLGTTSDEPLRPLLRRLTTVMRYAGAVPVTVERFS